ncbi:hypothetical protein ONS95_011376 [Cadophora gregata]|uniref:uncharacterized protein n=1 Tax=Cadophora gregata TaxID=51156 RepID=UPI0026DCB9DC|nr:uncharacterized protein ONS95_011376 [Cadophora gregata]KAK0119952.1 hypothetical protein ONS95_011376 [Cadophora gregata]KAK0120987.1 hypothetical protein ONS96_011178 [Cadophora gregata f. sp. sojae]
MSLAQIRRNIFNRDDVPSEEELNGGWEAPASAPEIGPSISPCPKSLMPSHDNTVPQPSTPTIAGSKGASNELSVPKHYKKHRLYSSLGDLISLRVGPDSVPLSIHRDVLLAASPGLAEMCNLFVSPNDRTIFLLNQCPETIRALCYWMYHDEICISHTIEQRPINCLDPLQTAPGLFVKLYLAGDKFFMPGLRNDAIDALLSRSRTLDLVKLSRYIYGQTQPGSNLRKLVVKAVSSKFDADDLYEHRCWIREDFLLDLAKAAFLDRDQGFNRFRDRKPPQEGFCANFHKHEKGMPRCEMMKGYVVAEDERPE